MTSRRIAIDAPNQSKKILVPSITLDELLAKEGVRKIDFLSMDIDAEVAALAGFSVQRWRHLIPRARRAAADVLRPVPHQICRSDDERLEVLRLVAAGPDDPQGP